ncbi:hypothetical protein [Mangrovibacterium sp.]|uniref:hypothetical protein n=1 Tax=Mangrovibacterium sp. TaxID=1961364 RepID=UPI0035680292
MKKTMKLLLAFGLATIFALNVQAQDEEAASSWDTGLDIYSSYIWRGAKFGEGAALQPYVEFSTGGFALGAWGSVNSGSSESLEMDLYASYSIGAVSLTVTDYYFGGDWTSPKSTHYLEPSLGVSAGDFSFTAAYMLLPEDGETKFGEEGDTYLEAGYSFGSFDVALGAGDGQYSDDGDFAVCNISVGTSKDIVVTDTFTLPVSGAVILNPSTGGFFITAGISF